MQVVETIRGASPLVLALGIGLLVLNVVPFVLGGLAFRKRRRWSLVAVPFALSALCALMVIFDIGLFGHLDIWVEMWLIANAVFCTYAWKTLKSSEA